MVEDEHTDRDGIAQNDKNTNPGTAAYLVNSIPDSRGSGSRLYREVEIAGEEWSVDTLVDLERIRRERSGVWVRLNRALDDEATLQVVLSLLRREQRTYDDLSENAGYGRQTVRKRVYDLRDAGVVEVGGNPSVVSFVDDEVRLLASDVLSFLS